MTDEVGIEAAQGCCATREREESRVLWTWSLVIVSGLADWQAVLVVAAGDGDWDGGAPLCL